MSQSTNPLLSVCVAFHKDALMICRFLNSLLLYPPKMRYEIILTGDCVDVAGQVALNTHLQRLRTAEARPQTIDLLHLPRRVPMAVKQNLNVSLAEGDYVLICDDDISFTHDAWDTLILWHFEQQTEAQGSGLIGISAVTQGTGWRPQKIPPDYNRDEHIHKLIQVGQYPGLCWMAPRHVFGPRSVGLFRSFGWANSSDIDWCQRACKVFGYRLGIARDVVVQHGPREQVNNLSGLRRYEANTWRGQGARGLLGYKTS